MKTILEFLEAEFVGKQTDVFKRTQIRGMVSYTHKMYDTKCSYEHIGVGIVTAINTVAVPDDGMYLENGAIAVLILNVEVNGSNYRIELDFENDTLIN